MEKLELVAAGGISPVRTDPDLVVVASALLSFCLLKLESIRNLLSQW